MILIAGMGLMQAIGHVDYYPNSGHAQPGCDKDPITNILTEGGLFKGDAINYLINSLSY